MPSSKDKVLCPECNKNYKTKKALTCKPCQMERMNAAREAAQLKKKQTTKPKPEKSNGKEKVQEEKSDQKIESISVEVTADNVEKIKELKKQIKVGDTTPDGRYYL